MGFDYASLANTAVKQIADKGRALCYEPVAKGEYNPTLDELQGALESSYDINGVVTNYQLRDIDGTLVKSGDKQLLIAGSQSFIPKTNDVVVDGETRYKVIAVQTISPGSVTIFYKLQIRR